MFLLGDRYINTLEKMSQSPNSKFVVYPADLQSAIKGLLGGLGKKGV
jgi:regulator of protease activity HflC (stomatin/prohibitin superfamily)